jgi:predicted XRE-type DNA-binding protein
MNPAGRKTTRDGMKIRQAYLASLALESSNNQKNQNANIIYKQTGESPVKQTDVRTTTDKYAGMEGLKQLLRDTLVGENIMSSHVAEDVVQNLSADQLQFFSQYRDFIIKDFKPKNVPAKVFLDYLKRLIKKTEITKGVEYGIQENTGQGILASQQLLLATSITPAFVEEQVKRLMDQGVPKAQTDEVRRRLSKLSECFFNVEELQKLHTLMENAAPDAAPILEAMDEAANELPTRDQIGESIDHILETGDMGQFLSATDVDLAEAVRIKKQAAAEMRRTLAEEGAVGPDFLQQVIRGRLGSEEEEEKGEEKSESGSEFGDQPDIVFTPAELKAMKAELQRIDASKFKEFTQQFEPLSVREKRSYIKVIKGKYRIALDNGEIDLLTGSQCEGIILKVTIDEIESQSFSAPPSVKANPVNPESTRTFSPEQQASRNDEDKVFNRIRTEDLEQYKQNLLGLLKRLTDSGYSSAASEQDIQDAPTIRVLDTIAQEVIGEYVGQGGRGLKKMKGCGLLKKKVRSAVDRSDGYKKPASYKQFGKYLINHHKLKDGILMIKSASGAAVPKLPTEAISFNLAKVIQSVGTGISLSDFDKLTPDEKKKLHAVTRHSRVEHDIPNPTKDTDERELERFNILRGEIIAGNDSTQIAREFKAMLLKFVREGRIPRRQANEILEEMLHLG